MEMHIGWPQNILKKQPIDNKKWKEIVTFILFAKAHIEFILTRDFQMKI